MVRRWRGDQEDRQPIETDVGSDEQGQDQVPPSHTQTSSSYYSPPVEHFIAPHRCPHCENIPANIFPLPPYSVTDPDPLPHYDDLFPTWLHPIP